MKKTIIIICCSALALFAEVSNYSSTIVAGGLALNIGKYSRDMNPGIHGSFESGMKFNKNFGIGLHADYTWLSVKMRPSDGKDKVGFHLIDFAPVPKGYLEFKEHVEGFVEFDPGLILVVAYFPGPDNTTDVNFSAHFGLTYGMGIRVNDFIFGLKLKHYVQTGEKPVWLNFYIGYAGI